jgi:hypothetical protein
MGPQLAQNGTASIEGHNFVFDACLSLPEQATTSSAVTDKAMALLKEELFDSVMEGESRSIIVVGETFSGKAAFIEGLDNLEGSHSTGGAGSLNTSNGSIKNGRSPRLSSPSAPRATKRSGLLDAIVTRLFAAFTAAAVEAAAMGSRATGYMVHLSGFQTFRDGKVADFLSSSPKESGCEKVRISSATEFERVYRKMLKKKAVWRRRGSTPAKGDPTDPNSCVVITFDITKPDNPAFNAKLRVIEACGTETGVESDPLIGRIVEGSPTTIVLLHPSATPVHQTRSIGICTSGLEVAKRFGKFAPI